MLLRVLRLILTNLVPGQTEHSRNLHGTVSDKLQSGGKAARDKGKGLPMGGEVNPRTQPTLEFPQEYICLSVFKAPLCSD